MGRLMWWFLFVSKYCHWSYDAKREHILSYSASARTWAPRHGHTTSSGNAATHSKSSRHKSAHLITSARCVGVTTSLQTSTFTVLMLSPQHHSVFSSRGVLQTKGIMTAQSAANGRSHNQTKNSLAIVRYGLRDATWFARARSNDGTRHPVAIIKMIATPAGTSRTTCTISWNVK